MFKITRKSRLVKVAAATAAIGSIAAIGLVGNSPAQADPKQYTDPIFGFGSDTLQDVTNAFAGFSNGTIYPPLQTSAETKRKQIVSWDAFAPGAADATALNCITTKTGAPQILRPNGSGNGVRALSSAFNIGQRWPSGATNVAQFCGLPRPMAGISDFARSSSSVTGTSGPLVYIPFGRDALSFAYIRPSGSPVISLASADLTALVGTGPQLIDADGAGTGTTLVPVIACGIQTGSGTRDSWLLALGLVSGSAPAGGFPASADAGTNLCNNAGTGAALGRLQENNGPDLLAKSAFVGSISDPICDGVAGGAPELCTNAQLVIGFSASQFIARTNNVGTPNPNLGADGGLGSINGFAPFTGSGTSLVANSLWFNNATFGRDVTFVVAAAAIEGADAKPSLVEMFVGSNSSVCSATTTIQSHGFLALPVGNPAGSVAGTCGSVIARGPYRS